MTAEALVLRLRQLIVEELPVPGEGRTAERHRRLMEVGREDLSLAKLAEAHWDAEAILAEMGREPVPDALYAVWASEVPGQALMLRRSGDGFLISGSKPFCSGLGLVDRALLTTADGMVDVDLRANAEQIVYDLSAWKVDAFAETKTGKVTFAEARVPAEGTVGSPRWYLERAGFWHGACGPAACWAGGVAGLLDAALRNKRNDAHTLAHLGALSANVWAMTALLAQAGREIDSAPLDAEAAFHRALTLRHLIETLGTDCLQRFARAYGPQPLAMDADTARRYQEAGLFMRQSHAERDLESLGRTLKPVID